MAECPCCGNNRYKVLFDAFDFDCGTERFQICQCEYCNLGVTLPAMPEEQLDRYYSQKYYGDAEKKFSSIIEKWTIFSNNRLAGKLTKLTGNTQSGLQVLDIGCGRANLLKAFNRRGYNCTGVERDIFPPGELNRDINFVNKNFQDTHFEDNHFDIVVLWHVLEHLTNPGSTINRIEKIMSKNGDLFIAVPNFGSLQAKLFRRNWFHLDLPRHVFHFNRKSLRHLLTNNNLQICSISTSSIDQGLFGFIQSAINSTGLFKPNLLFSLLKKDGMHRSIHTLLLQFLLASILLPIALAEYLISGFTGTGSCLIIHARKIQ